MKRKANKNNRYEVNCYHSALLSSQKNKRGAIFAVIYSETFNEYSARELYPHPSFPDRGDLFDWNSEDSSEMAIAAFQNGKQLDITNSIAPRKVVILEFPMERVCK